MKAIKFTALFWAIAAMVSCQQENIEPTYTSDPTAVKLTVSVGGLFTRSNPMGNAQEQTQFNTGDQIAVSAGTQPEVIYTLQADGTTWTPEAGKMLIWTSPTMEFKAYYPVEHDDGRGNSNNASFTTFTVPYYQSDSRYTQPGHIHWADRMTFSGTVTRTGASPAATFEMQRQMARVIVKITEVGNGIDAEKAKFDYFVSSRADLTSSTNGEITISGHVENRDTPSKTDDVITTLVIPSAEEKNILFIRVAVTPDRTNLDDFYFLDVMGIPAHEAGKSYTYNVKVGKDKLEITNVTVEDWTTGGVLPGGEARLNVEVNPATHTLTINKKGALRTQDITDALAGGTVLNIKGALSDADVTTIAGYSSTITVLNLAGADMSTVITADLSARTSLEKVLCNESAGTSTSLTWTLPTDTKHLYTGKQYGDYNTPVGGQTLSCYVLSVADNGGSYKLVFCDKSTKSWQDANTYCQNLGGHLISYDFEAEYICNSPTLTAAFHENACFYWTDKPHGPGFEDYHKVLHCHDSGVINLHGGQQDSSTLRFFLVFDIDN